MRGAVLLLAHHALAVVAAAALGSTLVALLVPSAVFAQVSGSQDPGAQLEEGYGDAFLHYRPYISPGKKPEPKLPPPAPAAPPVHSPAASAPKPEGRQPVDVAWLRKNYPLLEERAINDPSEANVASYLYVKRVVLDKAQRFGEAVTKVMTEDPLLNENNRIPYASTGAQSVQNANYLAEEQAVRELSKIGGLLIFVDSTCRFCAKQLPIASMVRANFGIEYLVVSLDASAPKGFTGKVLPDNGLFKKLGLRLTPSVVFVPKPQGYAHGSDPNHYLIVSQGFYAADELVKQIAFTGHATSLLSKATMADLEVWDRGVAATADLGSLKLDPSRPEDIKSTLQPLLLKQYGECAMKRLYSNLNHRVLAATQRGRGLIVGVTVALASIGAHAGVLGDMTQMFMSNSTAPNTLSTSDRVGAFGGSFEMRAPIQNVNLVSFDPPRFDAGCGGIDLYGGSFSFINSQQLVQIFRAVAANAVGLAFKAAIKAISPSLDALITEFQTLLQHMNNLAKNSCQLAHLVVNGAESALGIQVNADGAIGATNTGMFSDTFDALKGYLASADSYLPKAASLNPKAGNTNMKAVMSSGSSSILGIAGLGNFDGSADNASNPNSLNNRVLISMMGYDTNGLPCKNQNASGTPDTTSGAAVMSTMSCTGAPTVSLNDLVEGGGAGSINPAVPLTLYTCVDVNGTVIPGGVDPQICTMMRADTYDYPGIRGFINVALFGKPDPALGITPTSILGQFNSGSTITLSPSQIQLIHRSGIPLLQLLAATSDPSTRVAIAQRLSEHVVTCVASAVGEALYKAANGIQTGGEITLSDDTKSRITTMKTDFMAQRQQCLYDHRVLDVIHELNESTRLTAGNIK